VELLKNKKLIITVIILIFLFSVIFFIILPFFSIIYLEKSTKSLEESAMEYNNKEYINNAIEVVSMSALGNTTDMTINNFEIVIRLDIDSNPMQMNDLYLSFVSSNQNISAKLTENICDFETLTAEEYFCFEVLNGNNDLFLEKDEVFKLKFKLTDENKLNINEDFTFYLVPEHGRKTRVQARTPSVIQTTRVSLWPVG
jgi:uncharacterized membrane protein